ncbi:hypothetical protein CROQUDRAFT_87361 [Cronartium quercuum f. sp. fusiforme G11]|uniref:Transmembrane protein n=1 Tax=Cronartium quercuum f. sp. fusiforme G11 TaxID=708437 RepID=A0A9P6NSP4_9BASI|nr:hypothetical protein CROQUDRAFT_87361 [Cronartium quercuum f. sp. fusiforme G11]
MNKEHSMRPRSSDHESALSHKRDFLALEVVRIVRGRYLQSLADYVNSLTPTKIEDVDDLLNDPKAIRSDRPESVLWFSRRSLSDSDSDSAGWLSFGSRLFIRSFPLTSHTPLMSLRLSPSILNSRPKVSSPLMAEVVFTHEELASATETPLPLSNTTLALTLSIDAFLSIYVGFNTLSRLLDLVTIYESKLNQPAAGGSQTCLSPFCVNSSTLVSTIARQAVRWASQYHFLICLLAAFVCLKLVAGLVALTSELPPRLYLLRTLITYLSLAAVAEAYWRAAHLPPSFYATIALTISGTALIALIVLGLIVLLSTPALWLIGQVIDEEDRLASHQASLIRKCQSFPLVTPAPWFSPNKPASAIPPHKRALIRHEI